VKRKTLKFNVFFILKYWKVLASKPGGYENFYTRPARTWPTQPPA